MTAPLPRRATILVGVVGLLAAALLVATLVGLARSPPAPSWLLAAGALAFVGGYYALERGAVTFTWRGHKVSTSLTEGAIYLGLVALPPLLLPPLIALALTTIHLRSGRKPVKGIFNIGHGAIAMAVGAAATLGLAALGVPVLLAAVAGTVTYSIFSDLALAALFSLLEDVPAPRVYAERLLAANVLALSVGVPIGLALVGLWRIHPAAILAAVPLAVLAHRHARLQARVDRELDVRRRLVGDARGLVGTSDVSVIAGLVLRSCGDLLDASRARLDLRDGTSIGEEFDESVPTHAPLVVSIAGRDGQPLGTLKVWERPLKPRYGDDERALLDIIANQAAHALESADALVQLAAQRDLIARQEKLSALGTLMAGVAHEINNPLTYMKLRLDVTRRETGKILSRDDATPEERKYAENVLKSVETFHRGVERLATLCSSLKAVARPGDGQRGPVALNEVASEVVTVVRTAHKEIEFRLELDAPSPVAEANAGELHQVALNLVKNAAEALEGRPAPRIRVASGHDAEHVWLDVEDNGPGIPPDVAARLFTPFYTTKKGGTGLGLSLSRQIVAAHGGELLLDTGEGRTRFRVRLPAPGAPVAPTAVAAPEMREA